jgi:hypothetical protein
MGNYIREKKIGGLKSHYLSCFDATIFTFSIMWSSSYKALDDNDENL